MTTAPPMECRWAGAILCVYLWGRREVVGVVWQLHDSDAPDGFDPAKMKDVLERLDLRPLPESLMTFIDWLANYTLSPPGMVLKLALTAPGVFDPPKMKTAYTLSDQVPNRPTAARERVMGVLADKLPRTTVEIADEASVSPSVIKGMAEAGNLIPVPRAADAPFTDPDPDFGGVTLSASQDAAAKVLKDKVEAQTYSVTLLDGVTGSGKTETYFEAVAACIAKGKQALILLPEIALTVQFLDRFEARFGCRPGLWHSDLSQRERRRTWKAVTDSKVKVLVGARSALFLPYPDLGLIIVDEEHEQAFKQEEGVIYHARDMAVVRASIGKFPIILSTATPSLETMINVEQGRYDVVTLDTRHGTATLPDITAIDMREDKPESGRWLSPTLIDALSATFEDGNQAMLFLNRRGYAPLTLCRVCGHRMQSPDTSSWLVEHRHTGRLVCHHTGFSMPKPKRCPKCDSEDSLVGCGPGVERVAEEVKERFPDRTVEIMSSDTIGHPKEAEALVTRMTKGDIDVLVGTQMMAKGYHFPGLTLVGVVDADLGLNGGDLRASERTFQLLYQVAGRAGRADKPGQVFLQSYMPEHEVMQALIAGDRDAFLDVEADAREIVHLPPFGRLAGVVVSGPQENQVRQIAQQLAHMAPITSDAQVLGPAPAPFTFAAWALPLSLAGEGSKKLQYSGIYPRVAGDDEGAKCGPRCS